MGTRALCKKNIFLIFFYKVGWSLHSKGIYFPPARFGLNHQHNKDTNYFTNDKIIKKILNNEINHPFDKFILPGEKTAKSVTERLGDGTLNQEDDAFINSIFD